MGTTSLTSLRKRLLFTVIALVAATAATLSPTAAQADPMGSQPSAARHLVDRCYGHKVKSWWINLSQETGKMVLWYSRADGGTACLMVHDKVGGKSWLRASIWKDAKGKREGRHWTDGGHYRKYAGGVWVNQIKGKCIAIKGVMANDGYRHGYQLNRIQPRTGEGCSGYSAFDLYF